MSDSFNKFLVAHGNSKLLRSKIQSNSGGISFNEKQIFYHAALASNVASWDAYINNLVREFYHLTSNALLTSDYLYIHQISQELSNNKLGRFNTPNAENTRNLLILCTNYDPIGDWVWNRRSMSGLDVRNRLNEILKVRHSFAHGFSMPTYSWNQSANGTIRLTNKILIFIENFFKFLAKVTDKGMKLNIENNYSIINAW